MPDGTMKAAEALMAQVRAHLDYEDDPDMQAAADALEASMHDTGEVDPALAGTLLDEVDALLDYEDDEEMGEAADALRGALPARAPSA